MQTCICQSFFCTALGEEKNCPTSNPDEAFDQEDCIKPKPSCSYKDKCGVCKTKSGLDEVTRDLSQCTLCELGYKPEIGRNDNTICTKILDPTYFVSKGGQCTTAYITDAADCNAAARALKLNDENVTVAIKTGDPEQDALLYKRPFGCSYDVNAQIDSQLVMNPFGSKTFQDIDSYRSICWVNPRCREGQKRVDKKCVACPLNTYRSEKDHDFLFCVNQTFCAEGQFISKDTKTEARVCTGCPDNKVEETYMVQTKHRNEQCKNQTVCGSGQKIGAYSTTMAGSCSACSPGAYQDQGDHRITKCKDQQRCDRGEKISAPSTTARQNCTPCGDNTFIEAKDHRIDTCTQHAKCSAGEMISSRPTSIENRVCVPCPDNTYQDIFEHQEMQCKAQKKCEDGEYITSDADTRAGVKVQECRPCLPNTYNVQQDHRRETCIAQTTCKSGEYISSNSTKEEQKCSKCDPNTFQNATDHRIETCKDQPTCGPGEYYSQLANETAKQAECLPCLRVLSYQDENNHRIAECKVRQTCSGISTGTLTKAGECVTEASTNDASSKIGNEAIIGAAAGGSVLLTLLVLTFILVSRHRAAAAAAKRALNVAKDVTMKEFQRKQQALGEAQRAAAKRAEDALAEARNVFGIKQCKIQKRSNGAQCTEMTTADYCAQHTCQKIGCAAPKRATVTFCAGHSKVTYDNPTFVFENPGGSSSTDEAAPQPPPSKFTASAETIKLGGNTLSIVGLTTILGVDTETYRDLTGDSAIKKIVSEFKKSGAKGDSAIVNHIIEGNFYKCHGTEQKRSLSEMMKFDVKGLKIHHVLAIRVYTSRCYLSINKALRCDPPELPHPFAATVYYITTGLKILRKAAMEASEKDENKTLWRGVKNRRLAKDFENGTDMSCMSTTELYEVAMKQFANTSGCIFRVISDSFTNRGADIRFLSVFPDEKEFLYPPLTYLIHYPQHETATKEEEIAMEDMKAKGFEVVTVKATWAETHLI